FAVAVTFGLWRQHAPAVASAEVARVEVVARSVWSRSAGAATPLGLGDRIAAGTELATEAGGRLALRLSGGHSVRLDEHTRLRLLSANLLALDRGAVYLDSRGPQGTGAGGVEIRTPLGSVRDQGTQFEVRLLEGALLLRVREGRVSLARPDSHVELEAGHQLHLDTAGRIERGVLPPDGAAWAWAGTIAPMMRLEGRTLREFTAWVARERGLELRFAGPAAAEAAERIRLNGSIDGMTLEEALDSVLPTCRMSYRIEDAALVIR
ncbi:MAG TPA: FecR family protein, partial [Candidatus Polarisedimenticolaceae bacterium]|nr:FecR family protein [Candidatus Polarisedimenticolaceae bacterium]